MSWTEKDVGSADAWHQLEKLVDQLHELARKPIDEAHFYRALLDGCVTMLAADGGAVWQRHTPGQWNLIHQIQLSDAVRASDSQLRAAHGKLLEFVAKSKKVELLPPDSRSSDGLENPTHSTVLVGQVPTEASTTIVIELFLPTGCSPNIQEGWLELLETVRQIAADYHTWDDYRRLRGEQSFHSQSLALLRRIHGRSDLEATAFEIANEGCRLVDADRLCVLARRGRRWRLLAASGVQRFDSRSDAARSLQKLAEWTARWGEPLDYAEDESLDDLPDSFSELMATHVDHSQSRRLVAVPLEFTADSSVQDQNQKAIPPSAVIIAEQFQSDSTAISRDRVVELAHLCQPALQQAVRLDRFGLRSLVRWSDRLAHVGWLKSLSKSAALVASIAAVVCALVFIQRDFEIAAPARLIPIVEQDVFASTDGTVRSIHVSHGDRVQAGELLATLDDPQLVLDLQRVRGELETTRERLEAIAVARTDREVREDEKKDRLTLSAEAEQLEQRLESLQRQHEILIERQQALEVRSPIAGTILTLDVQDLLATRPVARGQVLFNVADTATGWKLVADVPQDSIGHLLAEMDEQQGALAVRYRLTGDLEEIYAGQLTEIREVAVLDTTDLGPEQPAVQAEITLGEQTPDAARPGMTAEVRIHCGRRSLGYVWLHDAWETVYRWMVF